MVSLRSKVFHGSAVLALVLALASLPAAATVTVLPATLPISLVGGNTLDLAMVNPSQRWVLVVLDPLAPQTAALAAQLNTLPTLPPRMVLIVLGENGAASRWLAGYSQLNAAPHYLLADKMQLINGLQLPFASAVLGITPNKSIAWQWIGQAADSQHLQSLINNWLARAPANPAAHP